MSPQALSSFLSFSFNNLNVEQTRYPLAVNEKRSALITFVALSILTLGAYVIIPRVIRGVRKIVETLKPLLTRNNDYLLFKKYKKLSPLTLAPPRTKPEYDLYLARDEAFYLFERFRNLGSFDLYYYRNSLPAFSNLILALGKFATTGNLNERITVVNASGQGSDILPETVAETFRLALQNDAHGNIQQTIAAILATQDPPAIDTNLASIGKEVCKFIQKNFPALVE